MATTHPQQARCRSRAYIPFCPSVRCEKQAGHDGVHRMRNWQWRGTRRDGGWPTATSDGGRLNTWRPRAAV